MRISALAMLATVAACSPSPTGGQNETSNLAVENLVTDNETVPTQIAEPEPGREPAARSEGFDTTAYCQKIGETAGGSYQIEKTCRDMESDARSKLAARSVPDRIYSYCREIGETAGGSYQIMNTCVDMETGAASSL